MARAYDNWERLVRATLQREQLRGAGQGHGRTSSGLAGAVPPSLGKSTNIDAILQAADEIQDENPNVARICKSGMVLVQNRFTTSRVLSGELGINGIACTGNLLHLWPITVFVEDELTRTMDDATQWMSDGIILFLRLVWRPEE